MNKSAFSVTTQLLRAHASIQERLNHSISAVHGISLQELLLLMYLQSEPGARLSRVELARRMHVSASTVTRQLAPLEKRGIIGRESDARDARLSYVVLTPAGEELVHDGRRSLRQSSAGFFQDRWNSDEVNTLSELLARLTVNLPGRLE